MMRVNWVALSIVSCLPQQPSSAAGAGTDTGVRQEGGENKAEDGSLGGQWGNKGDKASSRPVSEMNDSDIDDESDLALI